MSLIVSIPCFFFDRLFGSQSDAEKSYFLKDFFETSGLNNNISMSAISAWSHVFLTVVFSALTVYFTFQVREEARQANIEYQRNKNKVKDIQWLRARTLHVRGLPQSDRRGDMLRNELNQLLGEKTGGAVLEVVVIPDF
jgi:hypothetical protein